MKQLTPIKKFGRRAGLKTVFEADRALRRFGFQIDRVPEHDWAEWQERVASGTRQKVLSARTIDLVVDIGANTGQYGASIRSIGYTGPIISFEPQRDCLRQLNEAASADGAWNVVPVAVGAAEGELELNVSGNSVSSSVLPMLDAHSNAAPSSKYVTTETVPVKTADGVLGEAPYASAKSIWLKIDTQGYEWPVLEGAHETLQRSSVVEVELSFRPLYEGQRLAPDITAELSRHGFVLHAMNEVFVDPDSGELLQVDGIFVRSAK